MVTLVNTRLMNLSAAIFLFSVMSDECFGHMFQVHPDVFVKSVFSALLFFFFFSTHQPSEGNSVEPLSRNMGINNSLKTAES